MFAICFVGLGVYLVEQVDNKAALVERAEEFASQTGFSWQIFDLNNQAEELHFALLCHAEEIEEDELERVHPNVDSLWIEVSLDHETAYEADMDR